LYIFPNIFTTIIQKTHKKLEKKKIIIIIIIMYNFIIEESPFFSKSRQMIDRPKTGINEIDTHIIMK